MPDIVYYALYVVLLLLILSFIIIIFMNVRARKLDRFVGSFRCWMRPDPQAGWTSGITHYGIETLSWYRLTTLSYKPELIISRRGLSISPPIERTGDGSIVEIRLSSDDIRCEFAIEVSAYNGLVAWVESGPPKVVHPEAAQDI